MFLEPLVEELARYLDGQHVVRKANGYNGEEPRRIGLLRSVVLDDLKTLFPYFVVALGHEKNAPFGAIVWNCKDLMKIVNKKFFLLLTLNFFHRILRALSVVKNCSIRNILIYRVLR